MYIFPSCSHHISIIFPKHPGAQLLRRPTSVPSSRVSFARARPWPFPSAGHSASGHRFGARKLLRVIFCHIYLVGGFNHLEQYESQWLVDYPIYYGNFKKMKPPTSVPIIILCLVYAYHPIMVHHIKSLGEAGGFDFGMCFTCFTSAAPSTIPWEPEQNGWTPTSAYKIVPARQSGWPELGAWLSYDGSRPLYNLTLMICSFTSNNIFQPWQVIRVF